MTFGLIYLAVGLVLTIYFMRRAYSIQPGEETNREMFLSFGLLSLVWLPASIVYAAWWAFEKVQEWRGCKREAIFDGTASSRFRVNKNKKTTDV